MRMTDARTSLTMGPAGSTSTPVVGDIRSERGATVERESHCAILAVAEDVGEQSFRPAIHEVACSSAFGRPRLCELLHEKRRSGLRTDHPDGVGFVRDACAHQCGISHSPCNEYPVVSPVAQTLAPG